MATNLLHDLDREMDKQIREVFLTRMSDYAPEFPMYTKEMPWPSEGGYLDEFIRGYQRRSIEPASVKTETERIPTQRIYQGRTKDVYQIRFATGLAFSYEKMRIGLKKLNSVNNVTELLNDSVRMTMENYYIRLLADAANPNCPVEMRGFDGQPPVAGEHTLLKTGLTHSNLYGWSQADPFGIPADPSYTVIHDLITMMARTVSEDGMPYPMYKLNSLVIPVESETACLEIIKSMGRPDMLTNAENVISNRTASALSLSSIKTPMFMPPTMWFAVDENKHSFTRYILEPPDIKGPIVDEKTEERWWGVTMWLSRAFWDWRGTIGIRL